MALDQYFVLELLSSQIEINYVKKTQKNPEFFCRYQRLKYGRSTVIDRRNSVCDRRKASFNDYNDHQCLDVTKTLNDFDSFATTS